MTSLTETYTFSGGMSLVSDGLVAEALLGDEAVADEGHTPTFSLAASRESLDPPNHMLFIS